MHQAAFRLKRAHLRVVEGHKAWTAELELTPARFDAMMVILKLGGTCLQRDVWRRLGLSPSTISKMLKAMVAKGFVWKARSSADRRQVDVGLTTRGLDRLAAAIRTFARADTLQTCWSVLHGRGRTFLLLALGMIHAVAIAFGDRSSHDYDVEAFSEGAAADAAVAVIAEARQEVARLEVIHGVTPDAPTSEIDISNLDLSEVLRTDFFDGIDGARPDESTAAPAGAGAGAEPD